MEDEEMTAKEREIRDLEDMMVEDAKRLAELKRHLPPKPVEDFVLKRTAGGIKLSELFAGSKDLIVIHNMGKNCRYCMMWADGFNGIRGHLENRAGLVLVSPDAPEALEEFAMERGWKFPVASEEGTGFNAVMGMEDEGDALPGVSIFHRGDDGVITKISSEQFGPFDLFSSVWHLFGRLKDGVDGWEPQYRYQ